ncbi:MAG: hypothetical protein PF541_04320 [Prolixibacteraceae bacterium]|jgi:hypothetical protein|nr:hypothetical protein [Prolixibacteraceae bacterium]
MKHTILILAVLLASTFSTHVFASVNTIEGNTNTEFGNYILTPSDDFVVIDNVAYKTWDLTYSANNKNYKVIYSPKKDGECCFVVRNEDFEIKYAKQVNGFGVMLVEPGNRTIKKRAIMNQIEYEKFVSQLVLTTKDKTEEEYLGLVACFMPLLFG